MKKIVISVLGILSAALFAVHFIPGIKLYLRTGGFLPLIPLSGFVLIALIAAHMIPALIDVFQTMKASGNQVKYRKETMESELQIVSGICIGAAVVLHMIFGPLSFSSGSHVIRACYLTANLLMYTAVCVHLAVSVPHVFITFGIVTDSVLYRVIRIISWVAAAAVLVLLVCSNIYLAGWYN
jgi:hypothetical protein